MQRIGPTIQGVLQETLARLAGHVVSVVGAGRTDAGVHALGQVAHFHFPRKESVKDLRKTLNALLPWDIRVMNLVPAAPEFHARRDARRKRYEYRIFTGNPLPPLLHNQVFHRVRELDVERVRRAAQHLVGFHDFSAFAAAQSRVQDTRRKVFVSEFRQKGRFLTYRVEATGFLHHMVRNIMGTLMEVGEGRREPEEIIQLLAIGNRRLAGPTAAPEGLYLVRIWYT